MNFKARQLLGETVVGDSLYFIDETDYQNKYGQEKPLLILKIENKEDITQIRHTVDDFLLSRISNWKNPARLRILVALSEAVTNVIKHASDGQVLLYIDKSGPRFHVIDNGPGIKPSFPSKPLLAKKVSGGNSLRAGFYIMMRYFNKIVICTSDYGTKLVLISDLSQLAD